MKITKYLVFSLIFISLNIIHIKASCTNEELNNLKEIAKEIKVTYKHLGEVIKEDNSKVYNEFIVSTSNLDEDFYIILTPMTNENFYEEEGKLKLKLTTGTWTYNIYSKKCDNLVRTIKIYLPTFNTYSLDPLCVGVNSEEFELCGKYYEYEVSRETFERKVNAYRKENKIGEEYKIQEKENNKFNIYKVLSFIEKYNIYILISLGVILLVLITIIIITKQRRRKILQ